MMPMPVGFHVVVMEIECSQSLHVRHAQGGAHVFSGVIAPAAAFDLGPRFGSQFCDGVIGLSPQSNITLQLMQCGARSGGSVRGNCHLYRIFTLWREPNLGYMHL